MAKDITQNYPFDTSRFVTDNRVHVQHGSSFADTFLVVHPRELTPQNEAKLKAKLYRTYSMDDPPFYAFRPRAQIAVQLAGLVPISKEAKQSTLLKDIQKLAKQAETGKDPDAAELDNRQEHPFDALIKEAMKQPDKDPSAVEMLSNGLALYIIFSEALRQKGYADPLSSYVKRMGHSQNILAELQDKLGVRPEDVMKAARSAEGTGGVEAVASLLGVSNGFVSEVKDLTKYAADHRFSMNAVEHWAIGRAQPGMQAATLDQKLEAGKLARINGKIQGLRGQAAGRFDVPDDIKATETKIASAFKLLPPVLTELLYELGLEIAYTPEFTVDAIAPGSHAYGFHRKVTNKPGDTYGLYHLYLSAKEGAESFNRLVAHEAHHLLIPTAFSAEDRAAVDALAKQDIDRLTAMKAVLDQWQSASTDAEKQKAVDTLHTQFGADGKSFEAALGDKQILTLYNLVQESYDRLQIESQFFNKIAYDSPESKFYEIISRYAELRCVRFIDDPKLLEFVVPGMTQIYDNYYIPHLEKQLTQIKAEKQADAVKRVADGSEIRVTNREPVRVPPPAPQPSTRSDAPPLASVETRGAILDGRVDAQISAALQA